MGNLETANIIRQQILAIDRWAMGAWGAKNLIAVENGLSFKVRTPAFSGYVKIVLAGDDTYTISRFKVRTGKLIANKSEEGVYAEDLVKFIDSLIEEKQREY